MPLEADQKTRDEAILASLKTDEARKRVMEEAKVSGISIEQAHNKLLAEDIADAKK